MPDCVFGGSETISLRAGGSVRCGYDAVRGVWLAVDRGARSEVVLPYPLAGVGGIELVASPDQRFVALFIYSGQSQVGYELFALEPALRHIGRLAYVHGEGTVPVFSPDSRWLAMVATSTPRLRGTGEHAEDILDPDADDHVVIEWAILYVQAIPDDRVEQVTIGTRIPRSTDPDDIFEWRLDNALAFVGRNLEVRLPWGICVEVPLPPDGPVTTPDA